MPWFCKSSRKKSKTRVRGVTVSIDDSVIAKTKPSFAVVLQDFTSSASDELDVQRGQVIEQLYTDGNWVYTRNVDGKCGYVPESFCYSMDRMKLDQWSMEDGLNKVPKLKPRPKTLHIDELPSQTLAECCYDNRISDTNTPVQVSCAEVHNTYAHVQTRTKSSANTSRGTQLQDGGVQSSGTQDSGHYNSACHQSENARPSSVNNVTPRPKPTEPQVEMERGTGANCEQQPRRRSTRTATPVRRTLSYRQAVESAHDSPCELTDGEAQLEAQEDHEPQHVQVADIPHYQRLESFQSATSHPTDASVADDVFLPETKKPLGIFRCLEAYEAHFEGEITLGENELVIVQEYGRGEWAWVVTSTGAEGLIPMSLLVRYHPGSNIAAQFNGYTTVGTQTELVVAAALRQLSVSSGSASNTSVGTQGSTGERGEHEEAASHNEKETISTAVQTECVSPTWFKGSSVSPNHENSQTQTSYPSPQPVRHRSAHTTPVNSPMPLSQAKFYSENALERHMLLHQQKQLVRSLDLGGALTSPLNPTKRRAQQSPLTPTKPGGALTSTPNHKFHQTSVMTAVRDYDPPTDAKNCMSLKKGDILYIQSHVPYPMGWLWAYHSAHRVFGYVPKNHVAYMYIVRRKPRQIGTLVEDEV